VTSHIDVILELLAPIQHGVARCPAHNDTRPSLKVTQGTKALLLYCHSGCQLADITDALGIPQQMLFYDYTPHTPTSTTTNTRSFRTRFRQLQTIMNGEQRVLPMDRFDDVLWAAYPTTIYRLCWVAVKWPLYFDLSWTEAESMWVNLSNGPIFDYLRPQWEAAGEPNWHDYKREVLRRLQNAWRTNQPTLTLS